VIDFVALAAGERVGYVQAIYLFIFIYLLLVRQMAARHTAIQKLKT